MLHYLPFTFFKFGFAFLAAGEAFLVAEARIAPADFIDTPCFDAMLLCTALNPGCFLVAMVIIF
jgi:hypothetical protein